MNIPLLLLLTIVSPPIERVGSTCPLGYYQSSGYCVHSPGSLEIQQAIPNPNLETCPTGWYRARGYCLRTR